MKNKVVAITGAASGIGRATALRLARAHARLAISDADQAGLERTLTMCRREGAEVEAMAVDVADREAVYAWARATRDAFGQVNVIINNAGVSLGGTVEDLGYEDFEWLMNINFWGVVYGTKAFLPYLRESGDGHVVNISSLFGIMAAPCSSAYNASKFAVRGFTEALSEELMVERAPVRVTCVHPGGIDTNIARSGRITPNSAWSLDSAERFADDFKRLARTSSEQAAEQIVTAIVRRRRRLLIGMDARVFDALQRVIPASYQSVVAQVARRRRYTGNQV
ncbi:SDR family NAD(P)-dependent oxidoreductase [Haliangium sp.]|uniref:SDR family NAD(P)-dependent oxidoreductase n=1 Tax=Haliangium sp. TaxID=2663208 RepID=UPI003D1197E2